MRLYCTACGKTAGTGYQSICDCGGMIEVAYDLDRVSLQESANPYRHFAGLLPVGAALDALPQDTRYTPIVHAKALGKLLGMSSLYLKDETVLPTGSTKDRMAAIALGFMWDRGVRSFCTSSTGNSSTAYAHAIRAFPGMHLYLFTAEDFLSRVQHAGHDQVTHFCLRDATFVDAFEYSSTYARAHALIPERGFFNLGRREGLKLAFFEATEQIPTPIDWYVQAVSSAMGVYGTYKGAGELLALKKIDRLPRLLCVQQDSCAPMVHAYWEGAAAVENRHVVDRPAGIAEAILRGNPTRTYPHVRRVVLESRGAMASVSEAEIRAARKMVEELEGLRPCFSASAAVAGLIQQARAGAFPLQDTVMVNLTGRDRSEAADTRTVQWLARHGDQWIPA